MSDPEYRFYYNDNGDYLGGLYDGDPIPSGWVHYTVTPPPSMTGSSIDSPTSLNPPIEKWSFAKNNWFVPFTIERLKRYRDIMISVLVSYDNGEQEFDVVNTVDAYNALSRICQGIPIENDIAGIIKWKNMDGNYYDASYSDMQNLFFLCFRREQDCRNAEEATLAAHAVMPYVDLEDAIDYFQQQL